MLLQLQLLLFLRLLGLASAAAAQQTNPEIGSNCSQTCGPATVPYPFGFSPGCRINLTCSDADSGDIRIGGLAVRNFSSGRVVVSVPPSCDRSLSPALGALFGPNHAPTSGNALVLANCTSSARAPASASACAVPAALLRKNCGGISCYYSAAGGAESPGFLAVPSVADEGCGVLVTSLGYEPADAKTRLPALVFETAELGWWLDGPCRCSDHANCTQLISPYTRKPAFYCSCFDGFYGDGFSDGQGCRKGRSLILI